MTSDIKRAIWRCCMVVTAAVALWGCSTTKHVPQGRLLLDAVDIKVEGDSMQVAELYNFLRQQPNHKVLGFAKLQLSTYSLSGKDSTKWYNKWLRNMGQAPVVYSEELTEASRRQLEQALINRGYMDVKVTVDTVADRAKRKMKVEYLIQPGQPHRIYTMSYSIPDTAIARILRQNLQVFDVHNGDLFDRTRLDNMRANISSVLRDNGYYSFNKDYIYFTADTVRGSKDIALTMHLKPYQERDAETGEVVERLIGQSAPPMPTYKIRHVTFVTDYNPRESGGTLEFGHQDTIDYRGYQMLYGPDHYIAPNTLEEKCYIAPGQLYNARNVERTYQGLSQLGILKFINIEMRPMQDKDGEDYLDAYILLSRNKKQGVTLELEGTNSEGDLGFGVGATYKHRNLAKHSELLTVKLRTAYESLSGNVDGFINNRYTEYAGEVGITFPKFMAPFLPSEYRKRRQANTEFAVSFNYQERPEYTRVIAGAAWKYSWSHRRGSYSIRHQYDLVDINHVRLPKSTLNFLDSIAPTNPLLRYSYEDHFIMRMGYSFYRSNRRVPTATTNAFMMQPSITTIRGSVEMAGNLLYAISSITGQKKHDGAYKIFGIQYAQYVKGEADYTYTLNLNNRSGLAFHVGLGLAVPYLNSTMVPFEKRFYAGGANSVRGWSVRTLGPGSYDSKNSVTDFINQCGDILLNLNMEYRAKLFWVLEGALFVDAGNIWTIRDYENQPGGVFKIDKFYKQIAAAYGCGIRMDFTYFLLRFDLGVKAHNPAMNQEPWPLLHPSWRRDTNFHFSVGYPF
ncbi:MAG: BamA/TamA family outer membrane protein [Bacteroidales bacterium]|nr:BamA/TamA family outer membrane protein [Bacteroidales bacterium]